jgi:uncharacterized membrane protein
MSNITNIFNKNLIISGFLLIAIDLIYLSIISKSYKKQIIDIQKSPLKLNIHGAIITYLIMTFGLNYFIIKENKSPTDALLLGLVIYGIYDGTNYALFKKWDAKIAIIDTMWGGILFYVVTNLVYKLKQIKTK